MMKKLLFALLITLIAGSSLQAQDNTPVINTFTTPVTIVDLDDLHSRTARVPVSWQAVNRPLTANLVFEQVFADGSTINVELPRLIPWVSSSGNGVTAPIALLDEIDEVRLRLRLVDLLTQEVYDEAKITLLVASDGDSGSGDGDVPTITSFFPGGSTVSRAQLESDTARIPVTWATSDRPTTANLFFEQILPDVGPVNIELPRSVPWVASSGSGMVAPRDPGSDHNAVRLRLRLVDLLNSRVYDQRDVVITITDETEPPAIIEISTFTVEATSVSAQQMENRTARIPVSWAVDNRPPNANLVFEQVLADGSVVNVELPRTVSIIPSAGNGTVAPIPPGDEATEVQLQVRLIDVANGSEYAKVSLTLPIVDDPAGGAEISDFATSAASVAASALEGHTARIPVTWTAINRPANSNLVFEQVLADGSVVNVELPRAVSIVPSTGNGLMAPILPGGEATEIQLQVRLVDISSDLEYDIQAVTLPISTESVEAAQITSFTTSAFSVNAAALQDKTARVPVSWSVAFRPTNTNLIFEQRLADGRVVNAELPRTVPIVPSTGNGVAAPIWPGDDRQIIILTLRLVDLGTNETLDETEIGLPIAGDLAYQTGDACFGSPYGPSIGLSVGALGSVVSGDSDSGLGVRNLPAGDFAGATLPVGETFTVIDGPACWTTTATNAQSDFRVWRIRTDRNNLEGWVEEYEFIFDGGRFEYYLEASQDDDDTDGDVEAVINSFTAEPMTADRGGTITLRWDAANASSVTVQTVYPGGIFGPFFGDLPLVHSLEHTILDELTESVQFDLIVEDAARQQVAIENLTVNITCPFSDTYDDGCPLTQNTVEAAWLAFENGFMVWRGDSQQIYALFNDGTYQVFDDTWTADEPVDSGETPPDGLLLPQRGFGKVWTAESGIRDQLGWAIAAETGYSTTLEVYPVPRQPNDLYLTLPDGRTLIIGQGWQTQ